LSNDLGLVEKLGEGTFAKVFKVRSRATGEFSAVKRLKARYRVIWRWKGELGENSRSAPAASEEQ
jgi:serine/threonine protein kinase